MSSRSNDEISSQQRIEALTRAKMEHNKTKLKRDGYHDIDDYGNIYWPEPIPFTSRSNRPSGGRYGIACIGRNLNLSTVSRQYLMSLTEDATKVTGISYVMDAYREEASAILDS